MKFKINIKRILEWIFLIILVISGVIFIFMAFNGILAGYYSFAYIFEQMTDDNKLLLILPQIFNRLVISGLFFALSILGFCLVRSKKKDE